MPESIENAQVASRHRSKRVVAGASFMAGVSFLGAHPHRALAQRSPHPTPITTSHKTETSPGKQKKDEARSKQETDRLANAIVATLANSGQIFTKETVEGKGLKDQESLPGAHLKVTPEQQKQLEQAAVHIVYRVKDSLSAWQDLCTGTKVSYGGQVYIVSARHCYEDAVKAADQTNLEQWPAYDFLSTSQYEYAVVQIPGGEPLVRINGLSMDTRDDWALLRPQAPDPSDTWHQVFDSIPAIDFNAPPTIPKVGTQGIAHGYARFNAFQPTSALVTYLGRYDLPGPESEFQTFDVISISQKEVSKSGCLPGFSGSSIEFADGSVSGPMYGVWDFGYSDSTQNRLSPFGVAPLQKYVYEQLTGINLEKDEGICLISVRTGDDASSKGGTMSALTNGFSHPAQKYASITNK